MQQPQSRPLLGDSVSSTTSPNARHNNPVTVLTQQQLQQLQQLQAQNSSGQSLTFALQQTSNNPQEQGNGSATGNHIVYVNQLNQLNQSTINPSGTGMGLPPATPTFGVGLNMGLPLSLLNTSLTSLTSNVITTSNPLLNLGLPSINAGLTTINPSLNHLNAINSNLTSNIGSNSINNSLSNLGQDLNSINTGVNTGINRLNTINSTNINSGLSGVSTGLTGVNPNLTNLNSSSVNQNLTTLNTNLTGANSGVSGLSAINPNTNLTATSINSGVNQGLNRPANALATGLTPTSLNSSSAQFPFQTIQSIQTIAPHIVASSNIAHVPNSAISQHPNSNISTISQISNSGTLTSSSIFTSTPSESIHTTTANVNHASNVNLTTNIPHLGTMHPNLSNISTSNVQHISVSNEPTMSLSHVSSLSSSQSTGFQPQRQYSQGISPGLSASVALTGTTQPSNVVSTMNTVKSMQNIQGQNISSPGSPFSIPLKSPASNIAPPTPSPSPNRLLLRSPASNSIQSNRNSPSPVSTSTSNSNFNMQMHSPMQSPMSVSQIQSPVLSPYPPAKSPHLLSGNNSLNNRSPAPGGSPGPPVVRPNTPILAQQGMQVLQIIHGTPQGYQSTPTQLVTRTQLFGNQQIQIAASKPTKQPPQILPKPPNQQTNTSQQKSQRATTTITNQVTQQSQPQIVLAGPQPSPTTATMIPTAQGLLLNQVLPSTGPVIVQQQPGGVQLILRTPASAQQQTHTAQLTQQQLVRVVTAQGMQLQGITPTFFAVPNGFPPTASPVIRHTPSSPAPSNSGTGNSIVIQNAMVQSPQSQISQVTSGNPTGNASCTQPVSEQNLLPPPKKKAKKKKKAKRKDDEPKLDLARIIKISGIGDDDDIFDSELTTESEVPCQIQQSETNSVQSLGQLSTQGTVPASSAQNLTQVPAPNTTNTQASVSQPLNSQLVTQLQMPVQNTIAGQFRLSVEDGKFILHHTPEPNQPEMDQVTAQALIRSLSHSGQNSQVISQLLSQAQSTPQSTQNTTQQRPKYVKSPLSSGNPVSNNTVSSTCSQNVISTTSPHHGQICSKPINQQKNTNVVPQETNSLPSICVQSNLGSLQSLEAQTSKNVNVQNLMQAKNVQSTLSQTSNNTPLNTPDVLSAKPSPAMFGIQGPRMSSASQTSSNQQNPNISLQKSSQVRLANACITTNVRQNLAKQQQQQQQQHGAHVQKSLSSNSIVQNDHMSKTNQNLQQTSQQETLALQQESPLFQHNQQITAQTVQTQNVQQIFEQNLQSSNIHHNSMNILQQQSSCNTVQQHDTMNVLHSSIQQNTINVLQQNTAGNVQNIEQNLQSSIKDIAHAQQNVMASLQQQNILHNTSVQQNLNVQQQKVVTANTFSSVNAHHFEAQNSANVMQQGINAQQSNQNQNILITTAPTSNTTQQNESQKVEPQGANILNSAANNIINNAPKITPEILNALSNLNPNDQLLIANANGQMQVISQQLLQQFLAGQLNATTNQTQNQNQTQKIVIGEPDANNQNLQGVQINTPTSQIIVNSSGGAPTIQNNIQNIVVQAAPSQIPQHIQIQNPGFPSQFIDNLNQQQIRNLGSNQPKKAKIVKKTKVAVNPQSIVSSQTKTVTVTRPTMVMANTSNLQKIDNSNKTNTTVSHSTNPTKSEPTQIIANGPLVSSSAGSHVSVPSNGQMVQRVQTIQLPVHMQPPLKNIQAQIQAVLSRKPHDETALTKLIKEQRKILSTGKVVSTTTVNSTAETTFSVNLISTVASNIHSSQNSFKTSPAPIQTQTSTAAIPVTSQTSPTTSATMPSSSNNSYINNITVPQSVQGQQSTISSTATQSVHQMHTKPHKFYQNHGTQVLNPSSANMQIFSPPVTSAAAPQLQSNAQQLTQVQTQQQSSIQCQQQSTQCQTDPLDFKPPNIQSPVKQELSSPIQVQVQSGSPASQVTSPRMISKGTQRIQSPVNTNGSTMKQLVSPNSNSSPLISPRQSIKRRATSPICRHNRNDLMEQQLKIDQNGATNPDMNTPFSSKRDACKRLVRYHCLNEQVLGSKDLTKADEIFEETAKHLLSKFSSMINKYTYLLLMESMREVRTSELMMIDRTFVAEEQSILNRLREQETKLNEELKKEEKPLVPKVEPGLAEENKSTLTTSSSLVNVSVKRELEDDFPNEEMECKPVIKTTSSTSGDYDEWLEIQKELGVYPSTTDTLKCKNGNNGGNSACAVTRSSKIERTRANGECLRTNVANTNVPGVSNAIIKDDCEQDVGTPFDRRWSSATDLERDLSEDTDLDGLALHSQMQCPSSTAHVTSNESGNAGNEHDEINAQVQSAIDSILNLKKRPTNTLSGSSSSSSGSSSSQSGDSKDTALDQAVRSILGS